MGVQEPPMSSKQRPEAPLCLTHMRTLRLPSEQTQEQEVIVGSSLCWKRMENQTMQLCACVPLHACMHTDTHNESRQTVVGTITVNTDGSSAKYITN